jgi:gas vesicle protein
MQEKDQVVILLGQCRELQRQLENKIIKIPWPHRKLIKKSIAEFTGTLSNYPNFVVPPEVMEKAINKFQSDCDAVVSELHVRDSSQETAIKEGIKAVARGVIIFTAGLFIACIIIVSSVIAGGLIGLLAGGPAGALIGGIIGGFAAILPAILLGEKAGSSVVKGFDLEADPTADSVNTLKTLLQNIKNRPDVAKVANTTDASDAVKTKTPNETLATTSFNEATPPPLAVQNTPQGISEALDKAIPKAVLEKADPDIFKAAYKGQVHLVKYLLTKENPNTVRADGTTPLFLAAQQGHVELVKVLLDKGADPDKVLPNGATPLAMAVQEGHVEVVKVLLSRGANPKVDLGESITPLSLAAQKGDQELIKILNEDPKTRSEQVMTAKTLLANEKKTGTDEVSETTFRLEK